MLLSFEDHARIEMAIATAERATRGEIVCVVTDEVGPYAEVPLAWASAAALLLSLLALVVAGVAKSFDYALGGWAVAQLAATHAAVLTALTIYALLQFTVFLTVFVVVSIPPMRRRFTPASLKRLRVHGRAREQFFERGLDRTSERTGVLIFISLNDRLAEVLADRGINDRVDALAWSDVVADLLAGARRGKPADGIVAAVGRCGRLLTEHFPASPDNSNELSDRVVESPRL
ncbi:MAG: TPM domain-containing protein [Caulobacterales bacterium]|nr:TPM domain-containing protein [Caulobacterales bacterium]